MPGILQRRSGHRLSNLSLHPNPSII
jgi:hypothetical protein